MLQVPGSAVRGAERGILLGIAHPDTSPGSTVVASPIIEPRGGALPLPPAQPGRPVMELASKTFDSDQPVETGGLLFGDRNNATLTITVDAATGPPRDSAHSRFGFERGTEATDQASSPRWVAAVSPGLPTSVTGTRTRMGLRLFQPRTYVRLKAAPTERRSC